MDSSCTSWEKASLVRETCMHVRSCIHVDGSVASFGCHHRPCRLTMWWVFQLSFRLRKLSLFAPTGIMDSSCTSWEKASLVRETCMHVYTYIYIHIYIYTDIQYIYIYSIQNLGCLTLTRSHIELSLILLVNLLLCFVLIVSVVDWISIEYHCWCHRYEMVTRYDTKDPQQPVANDEPSGKQSLCLGNNRIMGSVQGRQKRSHHLGLPKTCCMIRCSISGYIYGGGFHQWGDPKT